MIMPNNICSPSPSPSYSITIRVEIENRIGMFARIAMAISSAGGDMGAVDIVRVENGKIIRDITANARDEEHEKAIVQAIKTVAGVKVLRVMDRTFSAHEGGKIEIRNKLPVRDRNDLSKVYTPGVARVCMDIHHHKEHAYRYTIKGNSVAVVSDGTAVLGLGDLGPEAALPVMEGKAMIFKEFAGIDAWPICLNTQDTNEIVRIVQGIAPGFGGINLEDISAPRCFEIERRLKASLDIPVMHDDQHGTAAVILAALKNALKVVGKRLEEVRVVVNGLGAAGRACATMVLAAGARHLVGCGRQGIILVEDPERLRAARHDLGTLIREDRPGGTLQDALKGADVFIGLSVGNILTVEDLKLMAEDRIVFAMANPDPEIAPELARAHCRVFATGRSDYPNQINNVLAFPGMFRGALDVQARDINEAMQLATAGAIAELIPETTLSEDYIIPSVFDRRVVQRVSRAVGQAARETGVARRRVRTHEHGGEE